MSVNTITGRSAFLALLKDEGITHLFGNPGTTELPIMDALTEHPDLNYFMSMQESLVVYMAEGYSRASGKLSACNVHVAPGLGNAMGAIYAAKFANTPIIITAGQQELGHGLTEPLLYDPLVPIAEPLVKWAVEVTRLQDLPRIVRRAAKVAMTPPMGPVFISLPGDILNEEGAIELGSRTRIDTKVVPTQDTLNKLSERILGAKNPVILAGHELATDDALEEAADFASVLGCPVYQQTVQYGAHFLSEHPNFMGALTRDQQQVRDVLSPYDLLIVLGADVLRMSVWAPVEPLPEGMSVVQIGQRDWEMGKNFPTEIAVRADIKETLMALTPKIGNRGGHELKAKAEVRTKELISCNWSCKREALCAELVAKQDSGVIDPSWMVMTIIDNMPEDTIIVDEGIISTRALTSLLPYKNSTSLFGMASGGIGWGIPAACGVQAAFPDRPLIAIIGDGSSMYSIQALWTAANQKLPINYIICDNGGYRIIKERLHAFHGNDTFIGMDFKEPAVDFASLANSLGVSAVSVTRHDELIPALRNAVANEAGPNLISVSVDRGRF
ncbi:MAG: benzoylformate decarboxylase [Rhodospirillaceae bacterium]|nr:benzoylformate decarboxylase [Rhodospirillaceae bacterium]